MSAAVIHIYISQACDMALREIQLWLIKSELIQAVGRARLPRFDCTVKLYASIPLDQAEILKCG
jgi:uncharacterized protein YifN (PemK superfamily)